MNESISDGLVNIVRGVTRPALTLMGWAVLGAMYSQGYEPPADLKFIVFGMPLWWFGDRSISKLGAAILNSKKGV